MQIKKPKLDKVKAELINYFQDEKLAALAAARGLNNKNKLKKFLELDNYESLKVETFPQIMEAVNFILAFIKNNKNILVYGDYDVDGISSTSILVEALQRLSDNIEYHIPDRFKEGYGLNKKVLKSYSENIDLVISCDCGISNYEEVKFAKELGMAFVVTDHHDLPEKLPPADYILSPRFLPKSHQGYWLPGAGMAFFLVKAIYKKINRGGEEKDFLDLLLLAIIADVVPLIGENRYLFKTALKRLQQSKRSGLKALYNELDINTQEINEKVLGFQIAPILNSAGRIDNAEKALELLLAKNKTQAFSLAAQLKDINQERKKISQKIFLEAEKAINRDKRESLIIYNKSWHQGVIGIAAGRIAENYQIPVVLMTYNPENDLITGSARSIKGVNINNLITKCSSLLEKHGGHAAAAGFSLKKDRLEKFKLRLQRLIKKELKSLKRDLVIETDLELNLAELNKEFYQKLRLFAPFGEANPEPVFYTEAEILNSRDISDGRHKKMVVSDGKDKITALWWWAEAIKLHQKQKIAFKLTENIYQGNSSLELEIKALSPLEKQTELADKSSQKRSASIKIINYKNKSAADLKAGRKNTSFFLESKEDFSLYPLVNRDYQRKTKRLVFLTIPPSVEIMKEIIILTEAEELFITTLHPADKSFKKFVKMLMALIKYNLNHENGIFNITRAAVTLSEKEITIKRGIQYLAARAMLSYEYISYGELLISKEGIEDRGMSNLRAKQLHNLLEESSAFRRFILNKAVNEIEKMINALNI